MSEKGAPAVPIHATSGEPLGPLPLEARLPAPHVQAWRLQRGLTSTELAAAAGVAFCTVSRIENGRPGRVQTLIALARVLDTPVEALVSLPPPSAPPATTALLRTRVRDLPMKRGMLR